MAVSRESFEKALSELRKLEEERGKDRQRKFNQTVDLVINLREFDTRKNALNINLTLPHKVKDKKVAGFLENKSEVIDTVTKAEFDIYKDKKELKKLVNKYDFFIANAKLMPAVATSFGRVLGPLGKMPSPQVGILTSEDEDQVKAMVDKVVAITKIRTKEPSLKIPIGRQSNKDEEIIENVLSAYNEVFKNLPRQKENLKSVLIKFTMSKPIRVKI